MKRFVIGALLFMSTPALAADPAPTCGKTVEECQKKVDELNVQLKQATLAYNAVRQQRDSAQQSLADSLVNTYVQQQAPAPTQEPKK